jgi:hypothetical protein
MCYNKAVGWRSAQAVPPSRRGLAQASMVIKNFILEFHTPTEDISYGKGAFS